MARVSKASPKKRKEQKTRQRNRGVKLAKNEKPQQIQKPLLGSEELTIERAKFFQPKPVSQPRAVATELPLQYDLDRIVLQVRDSRWIHAYWEIKNSTLERFRGELGEDFYKAKRILRVYDVSQIIFNGKNAHRFFDIEISHDASNWYIDTAEPGRSWCVDLGLKLPSGKFITILRSNTVDTPLDGPSWITDEEWMIPDDMFAKLYGMGFGLGRSSPVGRAWQERVKQVLFSGAMASGGISSVASPVKIKARKFWLAVETELIVYGQTEPGAKVTVQGRPIRLRQDGTFTLRFALPSGKQVIPVKAQSRDRREERTITPIVTRETK